MAGQGGAVRAGRAFVELFVEDNKLYRGLDKTASAMKGWGGQMRSLGASLGAAGGGILAPLVLGLSEVTQRAAGLQTVADRIGETAATTSTLAGGFERAGVSAESFGGIMEGLRTKIAEAADANGYLLDNLRSLGPAARLSGLPARDLLNEIADSIHRIPNAVNQLRAAKALGLDGILPQLKKGREGIDELFAAGGPGAVTNEEGRQALELTRASAAAWLDFKDTVRQVFLQLLPTASELSNLSGQFKAGLADVRAWIKENRGAVVATAAVGVGLVTVGGVLVGLGTTAVATASAITFSVGVVKASLGLLLSPLGLVAAGVAGITIGVGYLVAQTESGRRTAGQWADGFRSLAASARETFGAISDAAGAGEWSLAFDIGLAALKASWANFRFYFEVGWNLTKSVFVDGWKDAVAGLKIVFLDLGAFILRNTTGVAKELLERLGNAVSKVSKKLGNELKGAAAGLLSGEEINAGRDAAKAEVMANRRREQAEADAARSAAEREALANARAADADLERLQALARWRREFAAMPWLTDDEDGGGSAANFSGPARLADVVKGGFNGATASQSLGIGDTIPQQQLDATRGIMANTSQIPQLARDVNTLARGGRLGA